MLNTTLDRQEIVDGVSSVCRRFDDEYWAACKKDERFPREFHRAVADAGWLGVTMPEEYGGGMAAPSSIHMNMFGPHPVVVHGTPEQKARWLPHLVSGRDGGAMEACVGGLKPTRQGHPAQRCRGG